MAGELEQIHAAFYALRSTYEKGEPRRRVLMHREVLGLLFGDGQFVDHVNGNTLDNRRANLRLANRTQNNSNRKMQRNNTTGFKGVSIHKHSGQRKYVANIRVNGRLICLGYRDNPQDAHELYVGAARKYHGDFARVS